MIAIAAAHGGFRPQTTADCRTFRTTEQGAAVIAGQLDAGHAGRFATGHPGNRRGDRRRDAAGAAARSAVHVRGAGAQGAARKVL